MKLIESETCWKKINCLFGTTPLGTMAHQAAPGVHNVSERFASRALSPFVVVSPTIGLWTIRSYCGFTTCSLPTTV